MNFLSNVLRKLADNVILNWSRLRALSVTLSCIMFVHQQRKMYTAQGSPPKIDMKAVVDGKINLNVGDRNNLDDNFYA